jgi:hypothetical protein
VEAPEVGELLGDRHPRIEAALLRHVAEPQPLRQSDRAAVPEQLAVVRLDEPEDRAHRGRLAGAVGAEEAEHPPARDRERAVVERLHRPERLANVPQPEPVALLDGAHWYLNASAGKTRDARTAGASVVRSATA